MIPLLLLLAAAPALPERVHLKTPTESFTASHEIALRDGRLWWRANVSPPAAWKLLPPDGLPAANTRAFRRPDRLVAISADGDNLVAMAPDGAVYYAKLSTLEWTDTWGPAGMRAPLSVSGLDAVAMSHRMIPYEDVDGNAHPVSAGVTTFYALRDGGRVLAYADPWLPPRFERTLCLPERGRFVAAALSASASTIFVMDAAGRSFTRLADFDTVGDDPALPYSWARERRAGARSIVRSLPGEDWREQPRIPGVHTTRITIAQTGSTNADRELRVEGEGGYWKKRLFDEAWAFEKTGAAASGPTLVAKAPEQPVRDETLASANPWPGTKVTLRQFNPACSPARLELLAGAESLDLALPFHGSLELDKTGLHLKGTLILPAGKTKWLTALRVAAAGADHLDVELDVTGGDVRLRRPPLVDLRFPRAK